MRSSLLGLLAIVIAALFLAGCSKGVQEGTAGIPEVYTGIEGVEASFLPQTVPHTVTSGGSAEFILLLENKGAVDVDFNSILLSVLDNRGAFSFNNPDLTKDYVASTNPEFLGIFPVFPGKDSMPAKGATAVLKMSASVNPNVEDSDTGFVATICYKYQTKLTANICIDASPVSFQKQRKPCDYTRPVSLQSQGAPVAVRKIEMLDPEKVLVGNVKVVRPKFKIYVLNVGDGLIVDQDKLDLFCTSKKSSGEIKRIKFDSIELNGKSLGNGIRCTETEKTLAGLSDDYILCAYEENDIVDGSGAFSTPLRVQISYGYTSTSDVIPVKVEKGITQP